MKGQKEAVVEYIKAFGYIVPDKVVLAHNHYEAIVDKVVQDIVNGIVSYGKDKTRMYDIRKYVRSMVKNHLNKASELNGGAYTPSSKKATPKEESPSLDRDSLTSGLSTALDMFMGVE